MEATSYKKYVIQTDEGYFYRITPPGRMYSGITPSVQNATIFEFFAHFSIPELEADSSVKWLYSDVIRDGGSHPRLIPVAIVPLIRGPYDENENLIEILWFEEKQEPVCKKIQGNLKSFEQLIGNPVRANLFTKTETGEILIISNMDNEIASLENLNSTCFLVKVDIHGKYVTLSEREIYEVLASLPENPAQ